MRYLVVWIYYRIKTWGHLQVTPKYDCKRITLFQPLSLCFLQIRGGKIGVSFGFD